MKWLRFIPANYTWSIISAVFLSLIMTVSVQTWRVNWYVKENAVINNSLKVCQDDARITFEVSQDYYQRLDDLTREYSTYRMRQPAKCVPVEPSRCNIQTSPGTVWQTTGLRTEWLFDLTKEADELREQMILCQDYLKSVADSHRR